MLYQQPMNTGILPFLPQKFEDLIKPYFMDKCRLEYFLSSITVFFSTGLSSFYAAVLTIYKK